MSDKSGHQPLELQLELAILQIKYSMSQAALGMIEATANIERLIFELSLATAEAETTRIVGRH